MYSLPRDVTVADIDNGLVLLDGRHGRYWQLNGAGAVALRSLLQGDSPQAAADRISTGTATGTDRALDDVLTLIGSLSKARLLVGDPR